MKFRGVVLDFNGTLVWDTPFHQEAWKTYARELGVELSDEDYLRIVHGQSNRNILRALLNREITDDEFKIHGDAKEGFYRKSCLAHPDTFVLAPGVVNFLNFLKEWRIPRTIATASPWSNLSFYMEYFKLERWFDLDHLVYDDGTIANKPEPDIYLKAADTLGCSPAEMVVVEDTTYGILSARAAGAGKIILTGHAEDRHEDVIQMEGIDQVILSFDEIDRDQWRV